MGVRMTGFLLLPVCVWGGSSGWRSGSELEKLQSLSTLLLSLCIVVMCPHPGAFLAHCLSCVKPSPSLTKEPIWSSETPVLGHSKVVS